MITNIFGKGDQVAIPVQHGVLSTLQHHVRYTHPSLDICYSKLGFGYALEKTEIPLTILLDSTLPPTTNFIAEDLICDYVVIDHSGHIWRMNFKWSLDGIQGAKHYFIDHSHNGWWIDNSGGWDEGTFPDVSSFHGFLYTNPSVEKINQYWKTYGGNTDLQWLSIKDIVEKLNKDHPRKDM